ncbi:MAG: NAD(P)/FAD-dependent oxidoreductase [Clostridia bacterium]|nr:NAD(P)/FAD-dependent oxidoreductase [Clostridia bacterium]
MRVAVIGGGAAGQLAAIEAAKKGHEVHLYDRNEKLGKKLYLTGKGRCNLTNDCDRDEFFANVVKNPRFLYSALAEYDKEDITALLKSRGVEIKTERGGRVFPASDKSSDVLKALLLECKARGVNIHLNAEVTDILTEGQVVCGIVANGEELRFDAAILCCGGLSYPQTGSDGAGLKLAERLGHRIISPKAALVPIETCEDFCFELAGTSLKNVRLRAYRGEKEIFSELGEMLFTHFGVSGPLVLSLSSIIADEPQGVRLEIDFKPALSAEQVDARLLRELDANRKKQLMGALASLLPQRLLKTLLEQAGVQAETKAAELSRNQRESIAKKLKAMPLTIKALRPIEEAIITRGGVSTREINPSTMESKLISKLYFAGEMIDVDALTGGFNLQIAWSTGALAGRSV